MPTQQLKLPIPLKELKKTLKQHGVIKASVFGSYARGEATQKSDLDLLVECQEGVSLFDVLGLQQLLTEKAGVPVEITTKISPYFTEYIEPELVNIDL